MNKRPGQSVLEDVYLYNLETGCLGLLACNKLYLYENNYKMSIIIIWSDCFLLYV